MGAFAAPYCYRVGTDPTRHRRAESMNKIVTLWAPDARPSAQAPPLEIADKIVHNLFETLWRLG
jgi:hypothetical protein